MDKRSTEDPDVTTSGLEKSNKSEETPTTTPSTKIATNETMISEEEFANTLTGISAPLQEFLHNGMDRRRQSVMKKQPPPTPSLSVLQQEPPSQSQAESTFSSEPFVTNKSEETFHATSHRVTPTWLKKPTPNRPSLESSEKKDSDAIPSVVLTKTTTTATATAGRPNYRKMTAAKISLSCEEKSSFLLSDVKNAEKVADDLENALSIATVLDSLCVRVESLSKALEEKRLETNSENVTQSHELISRLDDMELAMDARFEKSETMSNAIKDETIQNYNELAEYLEVITANQQHLSKNISDCKNSLVSISKILNVLVQMLHIPEHRKEYYNGFENKTVTRAKNFVALSDPK